MFLKAFNQISLQVRQDFLKCDSSQTVPFREEIGTTSVTAVKIHHVLFSNYTSVLFLRNLVMHNLVAMDQHFSIQRTLTMKLVEVVDL